MKHFCGRDKKRYKNSQMGDNHCDGCVITKTCPVNRTLKPAIKEPTMQEQFAQLGLQIVAPEDMKL